MKGLSAAGQIPQHNGLPSMNKVPPDSSKEQPKTEDNSISEDVITPAQTELLVVDVEHDPLVASDNEMEDDIIEYPIEETTSSFQHSSFHDTLKRRQSGEFATRMNFR